MKFSGGRKILVTGAAGFIGSAICKVLAQRGWEVIGIDSLNNYYPVILKKARLEKLGIYSSDLVREAIRSDKFPNLTFIEADITDRQMMEKIFREFTPDIIVNMAAQAGVRYSLENPYSYVHNNIDGFLVLLECARHWPVRKFIYASSSSIYGGNEKVPFSEEDAADNPMSLYAATKRSNELMAKAYNNLFAIPAIGLRFFTVYGPWGRPDMAPMLFAEAIMKGETIKVFNEGNLSRDFTYIDDIVEGIMLVVEDDKEITAAEVYNIGHGSPVKLLDFISLLENALGKEAKKEYLPMQKGDVYTTYADTTRFQNRYGYSPSTELKDGIKKFADWFCDYRQLAHCNSIE